MQSKILSCIENGVRDDIILFSHGVHMKSQEKSEQSSELVFLSMNCKPGSFLQYPRVHYHVDFSQLLQHHGLCQRRNPAITTTLRERHNGVGNVATYERSLLIATDCERNDA